MNRAIEEDARKQLIEGLVGERLKLFHNNAHFYHSINELADMLPYWVDGIAAEAERRANQGFVTNAEVPVTNVPPEFDPPGVR